MANDDVGTGAARLAYHDADERAYMADVTEADYRAYARKVQAWVHGEPTPDADGGDGDG